MFGSRLANTGYNLFRMCVCPCLLWIYNGNEIGDLEIGQMDCKEGSQEEAGFLLLVLSSTGDGLLYVSSQRCCFLN